MRKLQMIWQMARYRPGLYLANALFLVITHLLPIVPGQLASSYFNRLNGTSTVSLSVWSLIVLLLMTAAARVVGYYGSGITEIVHRFVTGMLIRRNLLAKLLSRPGANALPEAPGETIARFRDDAMMVEWTLSGSLDMVGLSLFAIVAITMLVRIDARMTLLVFLPLAGVVVAARLASERIQDARRASSEATGRVTGALGELFGAVQAIKAAGAQRHVVRHFAQLSDARRRMMLKDRLQTQVLEAIQLNTVHLGTGLILLIAARTSQQTGFTIGDFALFVYYLNFVSDFTEFFGRMLSTYQQTSVSLDRMIALLEGGPTKQLVEHKPLYLDAALPALSFPVKGEADRLERLAVRDLTRLYPETGRGVEGVNLTLERGSFTVITGRIGSGKTTLLRAIMGQLQPDRGEICWNEVAITEPADFFVPPRSAYTPQIPVLFTDTVKGNILLGLPEEGADLGSAIRSAALERDLATMDKELETVVGARGVKLSGGQIQRVAAARMFVREPELFVVDDLSSALDVETERTLWERLFAREGATCLAVSHRRTALLRADQIIVMKDGRVIDQGRLPELLDRCEEMQLLWQGSAEAEAE